MAVENNGLITLIHDWWGVAATAAAAFAGWGARGRDIANRLDQLEADTLSSSTRMAALERLMGDTQMAVTEIKSSVHAIEGLTSTLASLSNDLSYLKGQLRGANF